MSMDDPLSRLERLARLREAGALSEEEFEREKARLLPGRGDFAVPDSNVDAGAPAREERKPKPREGRRWPWLLAAGIALAGSAGWALANWSDLGADQVAAAGVAPVRDTKRPSPGPEPGGKPNNSGMRALSEKQQVDLAFGAVFGLGEREIRVSEETVYSYAKGRVLWTDFGPVLIVEGSGEPYPPALGTLGIFYLREVAGPKFEEVRRWPDAAVGSIMGNPPQWKIRRDITDRPVIESTSGGVWQGYACDSITLTELAPGGPRALVTFDSAYDDSGAEGADGQRYDGAIVNVVRNRSFDVRFSGTATIIEHFVRKGARYERVPAADEELNEGLIPTC